MSEAGSSLQYQRSTMSSSLSAHSNMSIDSDENGTGKDAEHSTYTPTFPTGMRPSIQPLYRSTDRSPWTTTPPPPSKETAATSHSQECALLARYAPHPSADNKSALYSMTVQSPLLSAILRKTFDGYEGISVDLKEITFEAPFREWYYRWHIFSALFDEEVDEEVKEHLELLHSVIAPEILPHVERMRDLVAHGVVSFGCLWMIFTPEMEVYTLIAGQDRALRVKSSRYGASMSGEYFVLECRYVDCDGKVFGFADTEVEIMSFKGVKRIVELEGYPAHLHPDVGKLVETLHGRGLKREISRGVQHVEYSGGYVVRGEREGRMRFVEKGRIIVDEDAFALYGIPGPNLIPLESNKEDDTVGDDLLNGMLNVVYQAIGQTFQVYQDALKKCLDNEPTACNILTTKQCLLCTPIVRGYCLTTKSWAEFDISFISRITWNSNAFISLVLPQGYKTIIRAFVQEQLLHSDNFDDIIPGKGQGFILLLTGDPGVGKTLTAESVAESTRQPLITLSTSSLGETASEVDSSLDLMFTLAAKWNAILLLDEADMFLAARTLGDITRNRLVSVFLQKLEHYQGILFLTSNRLLDFDAAFASRIHLTIHYPSLDKASRLAIWRTFLGSPPQSGIESRISEDDLEILAAVEVNGREIKNIVKTARLLARGQGVELGREHVEMVLRVRRGDFS